MGRSQGPPRATTLSAGKPPDYCLVAEKPPTYEEAMSMLPQYSTIQQPSGSVSLSLSRECLQPNINQSDDMTAGSEEDGISPVPGMTRSISRLSTQHSNELLPENQQSKSTSPVSRVSPSLSSPSAWSAALNNSNNNVPTSSYKDHESVPMTPPPLYSSNPSLYSTPCRGAIISSEDVDNDQVNENTNHSNNILEHQESSSSFFKINLSSPKDKKKKESPKSNDDESSLPFIDANEDNVNTENNTNLSNQDAKHEEASSK